MHEGVAVTLNRRRGKPVDKLLICQHLHGVFASGDFRPNAPLRTKNRERFQGEHTEAAFRAVELILRHW